MDVILISAYNKVIEDLIHDIGLDPEIKTKMLSVLQHRVWELENWEMLSTIEES